jgi:penicillin-insensitive murein DD-endopeptidase
VRASVKAGDAKKPADPKAAVPHVRALSAGSPTDGKLVNGVRLEPSPVLRFAPGYAAGDVHFGLPSLVAMIDRSAHEVAKKYPGSVLNMGHLSRKNGGEVDRHASHESGRDADIGFYIKNAAGKPILEDSFVAFQADGKAEKWPGAHFDDARNWALVSSLLVDPKARITHIFVATPLRDRLLDYARKMGAHPDIRERASEVLAQPKGSLPHDDHFHVRIACPSGMSECVEQPTAPKRRNLPVARVDSHGGGAHGHPKAADPKAPHAKAPKTQAPPKGHGTGATAPKDEDEGLGKLIGPKVEGLDSVIIPAKIERPGAPKDAAAPKEDVAPKEAPPAKDAPMEPSEPIDDVDGTVTAPATATGPDAH